LSALIGIPNPYQMDNVKEFLVSLSARSHSVFLHSFVLGVALTKIDCINDLNKEEIVATMQYTNFFSTYLLQCINS